MSIAKEGKIHMCKSGMSLIWLVLVMAFTPCAGEAIDDSKSMKFPVASTPIKEQTARMKAHLTKQLAELRNTADPQMDQDLKAAQIKLIEVLLDANTTPEQCGSLAVRQIREAYARGLSPYDMRIATEWIGPALFWSKGNTSALYEYEKLTGTSCLQAFGFRSIDMTTDKQMAASLLGYELSHQALLRSKDDVTRAQTGKWRQWDDGLMWLQNLETRYGKNDTLEVFLRSYPFCGTSYILKAPEVGPTEYRRPGGQAKLLYEYCMGLESVRSDRMGFIRNVSTHYGQDELVRMLDMMTADPNLAKNDAAFYNDVFVFAVENGLWDTVRGLLRFAGEDGNGLSPAAAAELRRAVKTEREKLDAIQSIVDSWKAKPAALPNTSVKGAGG